MLRFVFGVLIVLIMVSCQTSYYGSKYRERDYKGHDKKYPVYYTHQHVYVTMRDGREVEAIVRGRVSKKKYFVRHYKGRKQGNVHEKYLRAISDDELDELQKEN